MNVVIDSLSRSGTTLFTSILNTNKDITATRGIFNECLSLTGWDVDWPKGLAKNPFFFEKDIYSRKSFKLQLIDKLPKKLKKHLILNIRKKYLYMDIDKFFDLKNYFKHRQNKNINENELFKLINIHKSMKNFSPDNFYQELKNLQKTRILCLRWNQCLSYYKQWVNRGNKWIFVKRDPVASAISREKIFRVSLEESIKWYKNYSNLISNIIKDKNFLMIKIENLDDKNELDKVKKFLNLNSDLKTKNIIGTDNQPYRAETSNLKDRLTGELKDTFDIKTLNKYKKDNIYRSYKEKLSKELKFDFLWKEYFDEKL